MGKSRKYYHSHTFGSFITGFALLAFVGLFAAFIVLPVFTVTKGSGHWFRLCFYWSR